ncbi:MAG: hypothetical protein CM15mP74_14820 [Halieaceae bacterium]|nr:MAG: hypothetical protein CM15mP74_14820 [Halieaceae bacterium]
MRSRFCSLALLLLTITCLPAAAEDKPSEDVANPHTAQLQSTAIEGAGPDTSSLPLEELQMFADVFNQIRQGYVESVPDSELFELAVQGMLSGLDPIRCSSKRRLSIHCRKQRRASSVDWV